MRIVYNSEEQSYNKLIKTSKEDKEILFIINIKPYPLFSSFILKMFRYCKENRKRLVIIAKDLETYPYFYNEIKKYVEVYKNEMEYDNNRIYTSYQIKMYIEDIYTRKYLKTVLTNNYFVVKEQNITNFFDKVHKTKSNNIYIIDFENYQEKVILEIKKLKKESDSNIIILVTSTSENVPMLDVDYTVLKPIDTEMLIKLIKRITLNEHFKNENKILLNKLKELNAQIEEELLLASEIQKGFLPNIDKLGDYEITYTNIPSLKIGGDYYDILKLDDSKYLICFADVSGHGIASALLQSIFRVSILKNISFIKNSLVEFMEVLNEDLILLFPKFKFVSFFACVLDINTNSITYSKASQEAPILFRKNSYDFLKTDGNLLGMFSKKKFSNVIFESKKVRIEKDDILLFYTDGITELTNNKNEFFGEERLINIVNKNIDKDTTQISDTIISEAKNFSDKFSDDISLLIIKKIGR